MVISSKIIQIGAYLTGKSADLMRFAPTAAHWLKYRRLPPTKSPAPDSQGFRFSGLLLKSISHHKTAQGA